MAAHQAPLSLGFSRQEHWSGLPFPSPTHESEKWKWNRSVVSDSLRPHGLQPTKLLRPWDFPGQSTGVGCHCLLQCFSRFILYSIISIVSIIILKPTISRIFEIILDALLYLIWDILRWTQQPGSPIIADVTLLFNACLRQFLPIGWKPLADWGMPRSLVQSLCPVQLCDPIDCSTPGSSVLHYLPEFVQTHDHWVGDAIQPSHPLSSPSPPFNLSHNHGFSNESALESGGQSIGTSALTKTFHWIFRVWSPLGLTGLISLRSQGLSRVFSNTTVQKHQYLGAQCSLWSSFHIHTWLLGKL